MATPQFCKAFITTTAVASLALFTMSCSQTSHLFGSGRTQGDSTQAIAAESPVPETDDRPKQIKTNHDVFHSRSIEVPTGTPVPAVSVRVEDDPVRGWNLYVGTANFDFAPTKVNGESSPTEGHAYLYINEEPIQRIYGTWTHLPTLPGGTNEIRVTLNANGHEILTTQNEPIEDSVTVEVYDPNATIETD
ncbi:MAG: hypothetical protein AAFU53_04475 [Cyanobacteria bacterium J06632_3]